ncbi:hypothetical protein OGAPHI_007167 [Ogataea philodendri]|uniref:Uncharacterized protein n=1 Tax=Ogataea philodendri TaxID=1378263 RepID=A0A9P8NV67_9ASCO|nr:uncharacterized protein OGAPHI_007167 [Ogataea philodendri]KAH3659962.1 hypothetical protein OGAPHI_007167 [Ogataea philodendri]
MRGWHGSLDIRTSHIIHNELFSGGVRSNRRHYLTSTISVCLFAVASCTIEVQVGTQGLDTFQIVGNVDLLIDRVSTVVTLTHWQKQDIGLELFFERQGDWNRTTFSGEIWLNVPHELGGFASGSECFIEWITNPVVSIVDEFDVELVWRLELGEFLLHELEHILVQFTWVHVWNSSDREFTNNLSWNDGLSSSTRERTLNSVQGKRRVSPSVHQNVLLVLVNGSLGARSKIQFVNVEFDLLIGHWLVDNTSKDTGVEVGARSTDTDLVVAASTQTVCEHWLFGSKPVVVRDTNGVDALEVLVCLLGNQFVKTQRSAFLHTFKTTNKVDRKLNSGLVVRLDCVQPTDHRTFVVGGTTAVKFAVLLNELEWVCIPAVLK